MESFKKLLPALLLCLFCAPSAYAAAIAQQSVSDTMLTDAGNPRQDFDVGALNGELQSISISLSGSSSNSANQFQLAVSCYLDKYGGTDCPDQHAVFSAPQSVDGTQKDYTFTFPSTFYFTKNRAYSFQLIGTQSSFQASIYGSKDNTYNGASAENLTPYDGLPSPYNGYGDLAFIIRSTSPEPTIESLEQFKLNQTPLSEGAVTLDSGVTFRAKTSDPSSSPVQLQVELRPVLDNFNETDTSAILHSDFVASGGDTQISTSTIPDGHYKWRARTVDVDGNASVWQEFGTEGNTDFIKGNVGLAKTFGNEACFPNAVSGGNFGLAAGSYKQGEIFSVPDIDTLQSITIGFASSTVGRLFKVNNPIDGVKITIRPYNNIDTVIGESSVVSANSLTFSANDADLQTFSFSNLKLSPSQRYIFLLERTGALDDDNRYFDSMVLSFRPDCIFSGDAQYIRTNPNPIGNQIADDEAIGFQINYVTAPPLGSTLENPVILLPGIMGSWTDTMLDMLESSDAIPASQLKLTEESGAYLWQKLDSYGFLPHTWEDLKTKLPQMGYAVYKCPYDWRRPISEIAHDYLIPCIDQAKQETGASQVDVVAHSMGGLVARSYLQDAEYRGDVDKLAMLGTPNHGAASAYYLWEGGEFKDKTNDNFFSTLAEEAAANELIKIAALHQDQDTITYTHATLPSVQALLPTFDYLQPLLSGIKSVTSMIWQNNVLGTLNASSLMSRLTGGLTHIFAGAGNNTLSSLEVADPNPYNLFGNPESAYPDGLPAVLTGQSSSGDGTVLSQSADLSEASVPLTLKTAATAGEQKAFSHINLPNAFFNEVVAFLGGDSTTTSSYVPSEPSGALAISLASPAHLLVVDAQGNKLGFDSQSQTTKEEIPGGIYMDSGDGEIALITNPSLSAYHVSITGTESGVFHTGATYTCETCTQTFSSESAGTTSPNQATLFTVALSGTATTSAALYSLDAQVSVNPRVLSLKVKSGTILTHIKLPESYKVSDIATSSVTLNGVFASRVLFAKDENDNGSQSFDINRTRYLVAQFSRNGVQKTLQTGKQTLHLAGLLQDGTAFTGDTEVLVPK